MSHLAAILLLAVSMAAGESGPEGVKQALERGPDSFLVKAVVGPQGDGTYVVPTTQVVDPAGETVQFPGRPVDLALSPDGALLAVKNKGDLVFVDATSRKIVQSLSLIHI